MDSDNTTFNRVAPPTPLHPKSKPHVASLYDSIIAAINDSIIAAIDERGMAQGLSNAEIIGVLEIVKHGFIESNVKEH